MKFANSSKFPPWLQAFIAAAIAAAIAEIIRQIKRQAKRPTNTYEHQKETV